MSTWPLIRLVANWAIVSLPAVESLHDDECGAMGTGVGEVLEA